MATTKTARFIAAGALLAASVPALADHDSWQHRGYRYGAPPARQVVVERPVYVDRPVYSDRPVYGEYPVYGQPAPVYDVNHGHHRVYGPVYEPQPQVAAYPGHPGRRDINMVGAAAGAAIGAVIGMQIGDRHSRGATTMIGAAIGGLLGSQF